MKRIFLDLVYGNEIDETYGCQHIESFNLDDIDRLARKAITLDPIAEIDETLGYIGALSLSYKDSEDEDAKLFNLIQNSFMAKRLLIDNVYIASMERDLRLLGTDSVDLNLYTTYLNQFKRDLDYALTLEERYNSHRHQ